MKLSEGNLVAIICLSLWKRYNLNIGYQLIFMFISNLKFTLKKTTQFIFLHSTNQPQTKVELMLKY